MRCGALVLAAIVGTICVPATAQEQDPPREPRRTRIALGPQLVPSYPGSDDFSLRPLIDVARARGDTPFEFEAPDESFGFPLVRSGGLSIGPAIGFEGKRSSSEVGGQLPKVGFTVEAGAFLQYELSDSFRLRGELRKGLGGHEGWIGTGGADYVARDGDQWLFSIGPRVTWADNDYHDAYFSVAPADAAPSGLAAYDAGSGIQAVGITAGLVTQLTSRWGIYSFAKYDRLTADAADSPVVERFGSRNQFSGGAALTYTFGRGVR
jgi:outer membrane scaffolding protein for murein synthesis (MipA/OmpV family)